MMKYVVIIPDGLADRPLKDFDGRTPVEVARTPHLDRLAKEGKCGLARNVPKAMPAGSDVACLSLLGYNPEECYSGRGPLEAASKGILLRENQYAFRCNLVTIFNGKMIDYSGGHISSEEGSHLIDTLKEAFGDVDGIAFYSGVSYRNLAIINDELLSGGKGELRTVAPHDILNQDIEPHLPEGKGGAFLIEVMKRAESLLEHHEVNKIKVDLKENPANSIWLWGQGRAPAMPSFEKMYGVRGAVISAVDLIKGISVCAGMKVIDVPGATGYLDTDYAAKGRYAIEALKDFDLVFVHVEAPDEAGHNGNKHEKVQAIEQIDEKIIGPVAEALSRYPEGRMLVSPDHPTPIELRTHTRDAVPFVLWGTGVKADKVQYFSESSCRSGKFGVVKGHELIKKVLIGKG